VCRESDEWSRGRFAPAENPPRCLTRSAEHASEILRGANAIAQRAVRFSFSFLSSGSWLVFCSLVAVGCFLFAITQRLTLPLLFFSLFSFRCPLSFLSAGGALPKC
jgi:hypothetical protein